MTEILLRWRTAPVPRVRRYNPYYDDPPHYGI
jgi:hypothetical protein